MRIFIVFFLLVLCHVCFIAQGQAGHTYYKGRLTTKCRYSKASVLLPEDPPCAGCEAEDKAKRDEETAKAKALYHQQKKKADEAHEKWVKEDQERLRKMREEQAARAKADNEQRRQADQAIADAERVSKQYGSSGNNGTSTKNNNSVNHSSNSQSSFWDDAPAHSSTSTANDNYNKQVATQNAYAEKMNEARQAQLNGDHEGAAKAYGEAGKIKPTAEARNGAAASEQMSRKQAELKRD